MIRIFKKFFQNRQLQKFHKLCQNQPYQAHRLALRLRPQDFSPEQSYMIGNKLYEFGEEIHAQKFWQHQIIVQKHHIQKYMVSFLTTLSILLFYFLIFQLNPRIDLWGQLALQYEQQQNKQFDNFWNTYRPAQQRQGEYLGLEQTWSLFKQKWQQLFSSEEGTYASHYELLQDLLKRQRQLQFSSVPVTLRQALSRGFADVRSFELAIEQLQQNLKEAKSSLEKSQVYEELGTVYYYQGYHLQPDGLAKYDLTLVQKSIDAYEKTIPQLRGPYLYGNLGWGYYLLEKYDKSLENSLKALALHPKLIYVHMNLGLTYLRMNQYEKSFETYERFIDYATFSDHEGAIRDLKELTRDSSQYPFALFITGYLYMKAKKYYYARRYFKEFFIKWNGSPKWKNQVHQFLEQMSS